MFLFSHMFGPILGNVIPGYLLWADPKDARTLAVLASSISSFWAYPFLLKYTGRYALLSFASIQNLLFAILWGCFFYGGLCSPFLPWLVTVPLLAFFYLHASVRNCITILLQITTSLAVFIALFALGGHFPHTIPLAEMQGIGLISIISASIYVSMMALYYARILASQGEFEKEVRKHLETARQLRGAVSQAERASAAKADFLAKTSHELRTPLNAIKGRRISLQVEGVAGVNEADAAKLEQILDALIDNAVCHAPNGDVEIVARAPTSGAASEFVEISVADKGPGIAEALVTVLFDTFNSGDDVSASKYGSAGLGLPLCHRLCGLMGASLSVRSAPRLGTTVVVAMPRRRCEAAWDGHPAADLAEAA